MPSFKFSKAIQQAGLESLLGRFCPQAVGFDTTALLHKHSVMHLPV